MSEISSIPIIENKISKKKLISSKKSTKSKKLKSKKKYIDISNQIMLEFNYENFEQETESFVPQVYKKENKITIENVNLLDQSHLRFLINPKADIVKHYNSYKQKNFRNITWEDIELIYFYYNENYICPICLESKLCCPVISKCGHVFCYPCIISMYNYHTKFSENKNMPNCPLCKEKIKIYEDEKNCDIFKICRKIETKNYTIEMKMKFNLILRDKKSQTLYNLIYDPLLTNWENNFRYKMRDIPDKQIPEFNFSRIFMANEKIMKEILNEYKTTLIELKNDYSSTSDELKISSINECINEIDSLIKKSKYDIKPKEENKNNEKNRINKNKKINEFDSDNSDIKIDIDYKKYCLFYQEENGDIYYLDPLTMEILLSEYEDYNSLPTEIEGIILDISMNQVTSEFKSKYEYLNHLRIGSIIFFVEIDIDDLISSATKKKFNEKLKERKRMRNLLKNQEKNYELFLTKKNSKLSEEEKDSTVSDSIKSLEKISGPIFFPNEDELKKNENEEINKKDEIEIKKENKLTLLFLEEEKKKEKKMNKKNKKKGGKNKNDEIGGNKGKKNNIKERVFSSESSDSEN